MARIVLGIGMSHTPMLTLPSGQWHHRAAVDMDNPALNMTDGRTLTYAELLAEVGPRYEQQAQPESLARQADACQAALDRLADALARAAPDVVLIVGDDQSELFTPANQPAIALYHGDEVVTLHGKFADPQAPAWMRTVGHGYLMDESHVVPGHGAFALDLIAGLMARDVDLATVAGVEDARRAGIGHAYGFVIKRLFRDRTIPVVPLMLNTYFPPNVPSAARCHDIGVKLRASIEDSPADLRVAVIGSGGLSHFIVDAELDLRVMQALAQGDRDMLRAIPPQALKSGSSEILNWVLTAGVMHDWPLSWQVYEAVYRTPAGTGVGVGFCCWERAAG